MMLDESEVIYLHCYGNCLGAPSKNLHNETRSHASNAAEEGVEDQHDVSSDQKSVFHLSRHSQMHSNISVCSEGQSTGIAVDYIWVVY